MAIAVPGSARAHTGEALTPHDLWTAWDWDPVILTPIAVAALLYGRGVLALWSRAEVGRGLRKWQVAAYGSGLLAVFIALVSPLDALGGVLFSGHMAQHLVLMLLAAPLLVVSQPLPVLLWALPLRWRRRIAGWMKAARLRNMASAGYYVFAVWVLNWSVLWGWHIPGLYQASLRNPAIHIAQHLSFLTASLLFWSCVVAMARHRRRHGAAILFLFTTMMHGMALGVIIASSRRLIYPAYGEQAYAWGLSPIEDQQLAGLIMWMPPGIIYAVSVVLLMRVWLLEVERRVRFRERGLDGIAAGSGPDAGHGSDRSVRLPA